MRRVKVWPSSRKSPKAAGRALGGTVEGADPRHRRRGGEAG
ncbi:MAG: hypothetical protein AVDCRST_MAG76-2393 [uncultured Acidimicrobiales bacterium]|uniref:Uncharacterized protein n=1 Tax=uncultured Acidimicrobiales bacterium TaxID=310071 RepID=A0A6J4ILK0_9ACTN|nr:MAG: hypothetical protein AVDCRST_MAG76-2393 [uncultured Acidimicrobiales bacterium]